MFRNIFKRNFSTSRRLLSTKPSQKSQDSAVNFRNFISIGIISSIILTQVVDAVNKDKPRGNQSISEAEYYRQQQRLKRKTSLFTPEEKQVYFITGEDIKVQNISGFNIINPDELIESEKNDTSSKFHALLNDPDTKEIPIGLTIDLIGKYISKSQDNKFLILNYPHSVKESVQFEDKIVTVQKLFVLGDGNDDNDVVKYYKTVDKTSNVTSLDKLE